MALIVGSWFKENTFDIVDGRNPAPVGVGSLSHYLRRVFKIPGGTGFLPISHDAQIYFVHFWPNWKGAMFFRSELWGRKKSRSVIGIPAMKGAISAGFDLCTS